ncbi:hypothetical protein [Pantanalinema sp. GBBB05]|uniref:hypothetical protein n=1 Tax=Pantanalinema sp. GBBB05 TaxID=2604139 RepID=UPI003D817F06
MPLPPETINHIQPGMVHCDRDRPLLPSGNTSPCNTLYYKLNHVIPETLMI